MVDPIHQKSFAKRFFYYAKVWVTDRETRNYNIQVQRVLAEAEGEPNRFLRHHLYHMLNTAMFFNPSNLKEETVVAYINLLAKDPSLYLRGVQFKTLSFRFANLGPLFRNEQYRTDVIHKALQHALYVEKEGLKPFPENSRARRGRNVVVGYIQSILDMFEPEAKPPAPQNRAARRRAARQNRRRGGPSE